eukprot:CAMPEP_0173391426 /NCGR_PEP_ID=MMETSP1356-20130122/18380_1 /TAXON_ID=77927 ORGANISM="Hemiselmis virescens, Strain PCC157" /NCGR_SAMPLE_ID=MMETSP1356 /ASSEMBLY_ACC=CAM_ASM_000847 /LENGTH=71 /DNA_ID=CAMNT_0014349057 /DNA_START=43 /DNA_END=255 /DNA_ORIENTATION=-
MTSRLLRVESSYAARSSEKHTPPVQKTMRRGPARSSFLSILTGESLAPLPLAQPALLLFLASVRVTLGAPP